MTTDLRRGINAPMSDTRLPAGFDELTPVRHQFEKHTATLHDSQKLAAFRLLRTIYVGRALLRTGSRA
jgi:hypothetical protein